MSLTPVLLVLFVVAALFALGAVGHGLRARRRWRERRRFVAFVRMLGATASLAIALVFAFAALALSGYRRLTAEAEIARIEAHALAPQRFALDIQTPDGDRRRVELAGDDWQLDARVVKWKPRVLVLGAPPLYRLERIGGRYRDLAQERTALRSVASLDDTRWPDLWSLKRRYPAGLGWVDAEYGSAAYLPLVDGGRYVVTLAAAGGLVARPADAATAAKLAATGG